MKAYSSFSFLFIRVQYLTAHLPVGTVKDNDRVITCLEPLPTVERGNGHEFRCNSLPGNICPQRRGEKVTAMPIKRHRITILRMSYILYLFFPGEKKL
jgi:hypothetical protein